MGKKATLLYQWLALLLAVSMILPMKGSVPKRSAIQPLDNETEDWVMCWETRWCYACGQESLFWVMYLRLDDIGHEVETMCLNQDCGAINGDLPVEDNRHWNNVFRPEEHNFTAEITEPTCTEGGYTIYTCGLCEYSYEGGKTEATGHFFGNWVIKSEPTTDHEGSRYRECQICGEVEAEILPQLEPEPTPEPTPEPEFHRAYVKGTSAETFEPVRSLTRAEAAVMLARVLAQARDESIPMADNVFLDVAADAWYANGIGYLTNLGLVLGRGNCFFAPKELITRAEFAVLLVRVYSSMGGQTTGSAAFRFSDVSDRYWAAKEIQIAVAMGWFQENQADNFYPYDPITRAEGVVILNRTLRVHSRPKRPQPPIARPGNCGRCKTDFCNVCTRRPYL